MFGRQRSFSTGHISRLHEDGHTFDGAFCRRQHRSCAGSRYASERNLNFGNASEPCVSTASLSSSIRWKTKQQSKKEKKIKLQHEYEEAKLATKIRRRRKWSADETKTRSGRLIRGIASAWRSLFDNKTYIVVNQQCTTFRFSESKSLFLFDRSSKLRQRCINLFIRPLFSHFIMLVILANCVCMMLAEPPKWIDTHLEYVFTAIYCFEATIKIIGRGFFLHRFSYLRDPWNWLDFLVIVFAIITEILKAAIASNELGQLSVLRAFRVLRALKTMSVVPGLRGIVKALLRSIRALKDAVALTIFCVSVFALIGYQLFHGTLRNKCLLVPGNLATAPDAMFLADWQESYYSNLYSSSADRTALNFSNSGDSSEAVAGDIHLPFLPTPLYHNSCDGVSQCYEVMPLLKPLMWRSSDANITSQILKETSRNATLNAAKRNSSADNGLLSCSELLEECIVSRDINFNNTDIDLSLLLNSSSLLANDEAARYNLFECGTPQRSFNVTSSPTSFTYPYTAAAEGANATSPDFRNCNVAITAMAANISCMFGKLGVERYGENSTYEIRSHRCYEKNTWVKTMHFGALFATRWRTRKQVVFFQFRPPAESLRINSTDPGVVFRGRRSYSLFSEYHRDNLSLALAKEWDCNERNYVMRDVDAGMYFYLKSSNRPSPEPRYCKIGDNSVCPPSHVCREAGGNPDFGYTNFDDFFWSFLTSFRLINQDAWSRLYYLTLHTIGQTYVIFYVIVMFLGSYYLINLILAVVYMAYEEQQAVAEDEELEEEEHKAERREIEQQACGDGDASATKSKDGDNGSHRSSVRSCCAAEEGRMMGLITTSLTSIADSAVTRKSRRSSRRNRYGHRRPPVKVDAKSEYLYRQYTRRHGDGMPHGFADHSGSEAGRCRRQTRGRSRQNSVVSTGSYVTVSEKNSVSGCSSQNGPGLSYYSSSYCRNCRNRQKRPSMRLNSTSRNPALTGMEDERVALATGPKIQLIVTPDTPIATPDDGYSHPFLAPGRTPEPVGARLKNSKLDVLAVDYTPGRSSSIYSTGSEMEIDEQSQQHNEVFLGSSSLKHIPDYDACVHNRGGLLAVPFDRTSRSSCSVSSNSEIIDGGEQVVQAEVTASCYLSPPSYAESVFGSNHSSVGSDAALPHLPASLEQRRPANIAPGSPLQVPSLMVTSASSEHIARLDGTDAEPPIEPSRNGIGVRAKSNLPVIVGSPTVHQPENEWSAADDVMKDDAASWNGNAERNRSSSRHRRYRRRMAFRQYSIDDDEDKRNGRDHACAVSAINSVHPTHRLFDESSHRFPGHDKNLESYEMLLVNGCPENAGLTSVAANMALSEEDPNHESRSIKKLATRYLRRGKRGFVTICCEWACCTPRWERCQKGIRLVVLDPFMDLFITLCIFLNTIFMMMEYHPAEESHKQLLEVANLVFTTIFTSEMLFKVIGLSPYTYFRETWNVFDAVVVISSLLEIILQTIPGLSVLRAFRLMRILKLAKSWPTLNKLLRIIGKTLGKLWHLTIVFLLVLFIFAVVGMQLLKDKYNDEFKEHMPRWNFVDFPHAFMVVFRIQCGEWIENMFTCMNVASAGICIPLFLLVLVIGNLVILNLFLALLLNSFSGDALQRTDAERNSLAEAWQRILHWIHKGTRAMRRCNILTNCCSKLRLQLCFGKRSVTAPRNGRPTIGKKEKFWKKQIESSKTETTILRDVNFAETSQRVENNNHSDVLSTIEKNVANHPADAKSSVNRERSRYYEKNDEIVSHSSREDSSKTGSAHKDNCHHCPGYQNHLALGGAGEGTGSRHRTGRVAQRERATSAPAVFRCRGCHKEFAAPASGRNQHYKKPRVREGFAPAAHFQNRPDDASDDAKVTSRRSDEDVALHHTRAMNQHFTDVVDIARIEDKKAKLVADPESPARSGTNSTGGGDRSSSPCRRDSCANQVADHSSGKASDEKASKHSDAEETDLLLNAAGRPASTLASSRQSSRRSNNAAAREPGRRRSNASNHSARLSASSARDRPSTSRSRSVSKTSCELEEEAAGEQEGEDDGITQCFPPYWTNDKDGRCWRIRVFFYKVATHRYFENVVIFCILLSSVALAFEDIHLETNKPMQTVLQALDKFFCAFFTIEMLIKWVGFGIRYYFTNAWCLLDFSIVFFSLLDFFLTLTGGATEQLGALRVLRTFRALRPLRALSRFEGMKVVVDALVRAIPSIFHVFLVCVIVWLIFSILGVNFFGGKFGRCVMFDGLSGVILPRRTDNASNLGSDFNITQTCLPNMTFPLKSEDIPAVKNRKECEECAKLMDTKEIEWIVPNVNFDDVGAGFLALMQVATFKGWLEIMANAVDITGEEEQPSYEFSFYNYFYFCIFIVFGAFFSLNLFIGVIIDNFNQQKVTQCPGGEDGVFLTDEQKRYYNAMKRMAAKAPSKPIPRPNSWFANKIYNLVTDRKFEMVVMAMILLNMVVMAIEHYDMDKKMEQVLEHLNLFFICVFSVEAVLKLIGLRLYYFTVFWNVFDIIVVIVSITVKCLFTAKAMSEMVEKYFVQPTLFRIIRLFRVTRILRLIREAKGIRTLLFALMMSLPALFNIGSLLFLVIFIYAILGMSQFAYVQKIAGIDHILNFETFPNTFLVLFEVSTSEGWNTFIEPILRDKPPLCDPNIRTPNGNGNCGNSAVGVAYFVTFVLITFLIVINMYIAIILENFEVATRESSEPLTADDFEQFFEVWQRYDDKLTQFVTIDQLQHFLHHLDYPLRIPFPNRAFIVNARMKITKNGQIHCLEVIIALIKKVLGDSPELDTFKETMLQSFMLKCKSKEPVDNKDLIDTVEYERRRRAAIVIQKAYKQFKNPPSVKADSSDGDSSSSSTPS